MLDRIRVLSFTHFVQGPAAAQHLADLGADVVKIEPPGGAWERRTGSGGIRVAGTSVTFLAVNRNCRAIAVDLKHPMAAEVLAADGVVAWFQGRAEYGPRALGHRSLLAHPGVAANTERLNEVKGREQFRPVAPMVLAERAGEIFDGVQPSPYMLFTHRVHDEWRDRIPAVVHVDGTARIQTVDRRTEPLTAALLDAFDRRTGLPLVVNTSLNTAGRPMVDSPTDALELFGSAPVDLLVLGPFTVERGGR